jgi:hypothetical protein
MTNIIQQATRFIDQKIDSAASTMATSALPAQLNSQRIDLVIYNKKALLQNGATIIAIISVALALFSVISFPLAAAGLGVSLAVRYCVSQNIAKGFFVKLSSDVTTEEPDSRDLRSKVVVLATKAGIELPREWKPGYGKVLGFPLFRSQIPWDAIFQEPRDNSAVQ